MTPTICTASGVHFDPLNPRAEDVTPADLAHGLSSVCRFGGHTRAFYSVAQHSVHVSLLVERQAREAPRARELAQVALLHDAAEAYLGDVITPLKVLLLDYKPIEIRFLEAIFFRFNLPTECARRLPETVKWADATAVHLEKRDLFPPGAFWPVPDPKDLNAPPDLYAHHPTLDPLAPDAAKALFLARFEQLFGGA